MDTQEKASLQKIFGSVWTLNTVWRTCREQWLIEEDGEWEREGGRERVREIYDVSVTSKRCIAVFIYLFTCIHFYIDIYIYIYIYKLVTVVEGDHKATFSIAITPRCRRGCYSFPWIAPLYS